MTPSEYKIASKYTDNILVNPEPTQSGCFLTGFETYVVAKGNMDIQV